MGGSLTNPLADAKARATRVLADAKARATQGTPSWQDLAGATRVITQQHVAPSQIPNLEQRGAYEEWYRRNQSAPGQNTQYQDWWGQNRNAFAPGQSAGAQYWNGNQGKFNKGPQLQGFAQNYAQQHGGQFTQGPSNPNYSAQQYQQMQGGQGANLDAYYDNAFRKASERINTSAAATGMLGSSSTADLVLEAGTNLAAEEAQARADYDLKSRQQMLQAAAQAGNQDAAMELARLRGLEGGAQAAAMAGQQDIAGQRLGLDYLLGGSEAASRAGREALDYLLGGSRAAETASRLGMDRVELEGRLADRAQQSAENRAGQLFDTTYKTTVPAAASLSDLLGGYADQDWNTFINELTGGAAASGAGVEGANAAQNGNLGFLSALIQAAAAVAGGSG